MGSPAVITFRGRTMTAREWAREIGIAYGTLCRRLREWPVEQALNTGKNGFHPTRKDCADTAQVFPGKTVIEFQGQTKLLDEWSAQVGLTPQALRYRIRKWGVEKALTMPRVGRGRDKRNRVRARALWRDLER